MVYRHRWIYVVLVVLLMFNIAYHFDIKIILREQENLLVKIADLRREILISQRNKKIPKYRNIEFHNKNEDLDAMSRLIHESGLEITEFNNLSDQNASSASVLYKISLRGDMNQLLRLLNAFVDQSSAYSVRDFTFAVDESDRILAIFLISYTSGHDRNLKRWSPTFSSKISPFCGADTSMVAYGSSSRLFLLSEMHLIGTAMLAGKLTAIILLPDGRVLNIHGGDSLGKDNGSVTAIDARSITLSLPDHTRRVLQYTSTMN